LPPYNLLWDTGEESLTLAPEEGRQCELVTQYRDFPYLAHLSRVLTKVPWSLNDGRYIITIEWRADNLQPFSSQHQFLIANTGKREPNNRASLSFVAE
jgi:hypothetical protein